MSEETNSESAASAPQLSPQGLALYKQMLDDIIFIKRQQWATTNYAALLYAAMIWFKHNIAIAPRAVCALSAFAVVTALVAIALLIRFQYDLGKLRERVATANNYWFVGKEKRSFDIKDKDEDPFVRGWHILIPLILVCIGGAALVIFALN
jgi:hypothetical protein